MQKVGIKPSLPKPRAPVLPQFALRKVISKTGRGVYASSDQMFRGAVFGRDSIEVAEDLLTIRPKLVQRIIFTLASLQGEEFNQQNEEEPGKIIHEFRTAMIDGKPLNDASKHIFEELRTLWGGNQSVVYYGSIDSTPHFIRLLGNYCQKYGTDILQTRIKLRSGHKLSMAVVVENALTWLLDKLDSSTTGLLEYRSNGIPGFENQAWKDSLEFYVHENGQYVNHQGPIVSIEVQGLTYDALMAGAELFPDRATELLNRARSIRDGTIWLLWQPQRNYFALGADHTNDGEIRIINTPTANPAALLDTRIFDALPELHRQEYVSGIVKMIMSTEFLTDAGIRSRGLSGASLIPFWDYHGSFTSWPKETYDIAKGLKRQGFPLLARELENRLLNMLFKTWEYPEFLYVDQWGRIMSVAPSNHAHGEITFIDSPNTPERTQAWTVSAMMAIMSERLHAKIQSVKPAVRSNWQIALEQRTLASIPRINRILNPLKLRSALKLKNYALKEKNSKKSASTISKKTAKV